MTKRVTGGVVVLVGVVLIVVAILKNLFAVGPAFEQMIDDFRPWLADEAIASLRADLGTLGGAVEEFQTSMVPALAGQLGMTPEEFGTVMGEQFPAVTLGMATVPEAAASFTGIIDLLEQQQSNFFSADAIPTTSLPATTVPWGILAAGVLAIVVGGLMLLRSGRLAAVLAVLLGALLVIGPFVLSLPGKSADADDLNAALKPVYTEETIGGASQAVGIISAMGTEMQTAMLPGLAQMLGMTPEDTQAFIGANFPATAAALQAMPGAIERFTGVVGAFSDNLDNYATLKPVAFVPIIWTVIIGGVVVLVAGLVLLLVGGARRDSMA